MTCIAINPIIWFSRTVVKKMKKKSTIITKGLAIVIGVVFLGTVVSLVSIYLSPIALVLVALSVIIAASIIFFVKQNKAEVRPAKSPERFTSREDQEKKSPSCVCEAANGKYHNLNVASSTEERLAELAEAGSHQIELYKRPKTIRFSIPMPAKPLLPELFLDLVIKEILLSQLAVSGTHQILPYSYSLLFHSKLKHALNLLRLKGFRSFHSIARDQQPFFLAEILAHELAYKLAKSKIKAENRVLLTDQSGKEGMYDIIKIQTGEKEHMALQGYIILPYSLDNPHVHIVWTGTTNLAGVVVDTQISPGEDSYRKREISTITFINSKLHTHSLTRKHKLNLHFYGHSLGGALAQLTFHSFQRAILQNALLPNNRPFKPVKSSIIDVLNLAHTPSERTQWGWAEYVHKRQAPWHVNLEDASNHSRDGFSTRSISALSISIIASMDIATWNSAGVTSAVAANSVENARLLSEMGVAHSAYFGIVAQDAVQTSGEATILAGCNYTEAKVNIMKVGATPGAYFKLAGTLLGVIPGVAFGSLVGIPAVALSAVLCAVLPTLRAHTSKHFQGGLKSPVWEEYSNETANGFNRVNATLSNKSYLLKCLVTVKSCVAANRARVLPLEQNSL